MIKRPSLWQLKFVALAVFCACSSVHAQPYLVTNYASGYFSTNNGYESPFSLDGQPFYPTNVNAWQTTDPQQPSVGGTNFGSTSIIQSFAYYTFGDYTTNGNNSVLFGGYYAPVAPPNRLLPGTTNPSLYTSDFAASPEPALSTTFSVDFAIRRPPGGQGIYTNRDSFGFTLWNGFGSAQIAKIMFNGSSPTVAPGTTNYGIQWFDSSNAWQSNNAALTATNWQIGLDSIYRLNITLSNSGTFDAGVQTLAVQLSPEDYVTNYAVVADALIIDNASLGGFTLDDLDSISFDWQLASGDSQLPGANFMVVNQVNVTSLVPEPSTNALLAIAALGTIFYVVRRRRSAFGPVNVQDQ